MGTGDGSGVEVTSGPRLSPPPGDGNVTVEVIAGVTVGVVTGVGVGAAGSITGIGVSVGEGAGVELDDGFRVGVEPAVGGLGVGVWGSEAGFSVGVGGGGVFSAATGNTDPPNNETKTANNPSSRLITVSPQG
jgi:hypothetical protein